MEEFASIVPRQPYRPIDRPQEVRLEFEAILLDVSRDVRKNQLWIHAKIKACVAPNDCSAVSHPVQLFVTQSELIEPVLPQAQQLGIHFLNIFVNTHLEMHHLEGPD